MKHSPFLILILPLLFFHLHHVQCHSVLPPSPLQLNALLLGDDDSGADGDNNNSAAAVAARSSSDSSSSSSSSFGSSSDEDLSEEDNNHLHHFLENVANWKPSVLRKNCGPGKFRSVAGQCRQCSICGPDLYEREPCHADQDTHCEWCLSEEAAGVKSTEQKAEFDVKCAELVRIKEEFCRVLAATAKRSGSNNNGGKGHHQQKQQQQQQKQRQLFPSFQFASVELGGGNNGWWRAEFAVQMAFYLALIALVLAIVRFLYKTKPVGGAAYRAIQVHSGAMPSAVLDKLDKKQIIRAADAIRAKLGKKGYERLEEEFI